MKYALLVIDMLNDFAHKKGALYFTPAEDIIPFIKGRIDLIRQQRSQLFQDDNFFIAYLCDSHKENDKEFEKFPKHAISGTWGSQIIDELLPDPNAMFNELVILKQRYSGFYNTNLDTFLKQENITQVEVVGVCTSICIMDTVGGLANRDIEVIIPIKGVADFNQDAHKFSLERMKMIYGTKII